jgi:very-short-patch-repair endonuclease
MRQQHATGDMAIAALVSRQHGVASYAQLLSLGLSPGAIARRVRSGRLHRVHRGVYAVGYPALTFERRCMAAALAYAPAFVSHRSAATLWRLLAAVNGPVEVSVPGDGGKQRRKGIRLHRSRTLGASATTRRQGIPVTTAARTLADLRRAVPAAEVRQAIRRASVLGLPIGDELVSDRTRSDLELAFLRLCRRHDLPKPEVNTRIGSLEVDFLWPGQRLVVETDGYRYHRGRQAFEEDRARDLALRGLGYEVMRFSYRQVIDDPERIAAVLRQQLANG